MTPRQRYDAVQHLMPDADMTLIGDEIKWLDDRPMPNDVDIEAAHGVVVLDTARTIALKRAKAKHADALKAVKDRYPQTEIDGWSELVGDAKEGEGVCIEAYAAQLGISVPDACERVLTVREGYRAAYGEATGELTKTRDLIDNAETVEDLEAIHWPETKP